MTLIFSLRSQPTTLLMVNGIISQKCWFLMLEVRRTKFLTYNPCCSQIHLISLFLLRPGLMVIIKIEFNLDGYNVFRKDRCNRRSGGVLLAVRDYIVILLKAQPSESLSQKLEGAKFKS